jgi:signal transduction histidine kinase
MSIVYNTIRKHNGEIRINTTLGIGTEFLIELPLNAAAVEVN